MGLIHPVDLEGWQRWQGSRGPARQRVRRLAHRIRPDVSAGLQVLRGSPDADLVVALDATHASVRAALVDPLSHLPLERVLVLAAPGAEVILPSHPWSVEEVRPGEVTAAVRGASAVMGSGHYTTVGALAYAAARHHGVRFGVVQHGLLTPWAPPLPSGSQLLAWSAADADFWMAGRHDVTGSVVGSALLSRAAARGPVVAAQPGVSYLARHRADGPADQRAGSTSAGSHRVVDTLGAPVYLGQLHGAELPRKAMARAAEEFCRTHCAVYRPHPSEVDRASVRQHEQWARQGIEIELEHDDLLARTRPVVSIFSTGVLEAAAAGIPAWVDFPHPPAWLRELWRRYGMSRYGDAPTPAPRNHPDPAAAAAAWLAGIPDPA